MKYVIAEERQRLEDLFEWCPMRQFHYLRVDGRMTQHYLRASVPKWCANRALVTYQGEAFYLCWSKSPVHAEGRKTKPNKLATQILSSSFSRMLQGRKPRNGIHGPALLVKREKDLCISYRVRGRSYSDVCESITNFNWAANCLKNSDRSSSVVFDVKDDEFERFVKYEMPFIKTALR